VRGGPAAEGAEVREGGAVIVVGVPQRKLLAIRVRGGAKDGDPLRRGAVDAAADTIRRTGVVEFLVPVLVVRRAPRPVLTPLNVQPDTPRPLRRAVALQVRHQLVHLGGSALRAGGARKHVSIPRGDARTGGILDGRADGRIHSASRLVATRNDEGKAGRLEAGRRGRGDG